MNKTELNDAIQAITTDIAWLRRQNYGHQDAARAAEKRMVENGVLIITGLAGAVLDIRDDLKRIADAQSQLRWSKF